MFFCNLISSFNFIDKEGPLACSSSELTPGTVNPFSAFCRIDWI
jgi:hypothetical protein